MRAVRLLGHEQLELIDLPDPIPDDGEVLIRVEASLVCGSEMHGWRDSQAQGSNGGHEPAGVVVDASRSRRWREGDRVGIHCVWGCGHCPMCDRGAYTWCANFRGARPAHVELIAAPDHVCLAIPDDFSFELGALLACDGLGVPYHTSRRLPTRGGDSVVVIGCGPIGLGSVLVQSFLGARVIALDMAPERLALARDFGADETVDVSAGDALEAVRELTGGRLADAVVEATGRPEGFALALKAVGHGGTVACNGENREVALNVGSDLIRRDITVFGSWVCHIREYPEMVDLVRRGLAAEKLVTHRFPLAQAATAFTEFAAGRVGKPALLPTAS